MATQIVIDKSTNSQFPEYGTKVNAPAQQSVETQAKLEETPLAEEVNKTSVFKKQVEAEEKPAEQQEIDIKDAIEIIAEFLDISSRSVNFQQDDGSEKTIIKVFDNDTKELIKQFPSDEVLEIAQRIVELRQDVGKKTGILLDEKV